MFCNHNSRHRGGVNLSPRWNFRATAVAPTRHRGDVRISLYKTEIICSVNLHNRRLLKYHVFRVVRVLTSGFLCCNFAKEIRRKPPLKARERDAFMKLKFQSAQPMLISHRPPLWGGFKHRGMDTLPKKWVLLMNTINWSWNWQLFL